MFFWNHPVGQKIFAMTPEVAASSQAQPAQTPDTPAVAPAALTIQTAAQPALLQAQLIATPVTPDAPVPADGLAIEIAARARATSSDMLPPGNC